MAWIYEWHINENGHVTVGNNVEFSCNSINYVYYFLIVVRFIIPMLILLATSILIIKKVSMYSIYCLFQLMIFRLLFWGQLGPLHVRWQISFGCWVTLTLSSWQDYYKGVFFPKAVMNSKSFFSVSQQLMSELSAKMNALNPLRFTSHQKNWEKCLLFNLANFWIIKLTKTSILPNCQVPNSFFFV